MFCSPSFDLPEDPATSDERAIISASPAANDLRLLSKP